MVVLVMGVEGSGKTTVGRALAARLHCDFVDGDDYQPAENVKKMSAGIGLTDEDRAPWLARIKSEIDRAVAAGRDLVVACSALKRKYREELAAPGELLVYLRGDREVIASRLVARKNHFAQTSLLESQFADLEEPGLDEQALVISIDQPVELIVPEIMQGLQPRNDERDSRRR